MAFVAIPQAAEAKLFFTYQGQRCMNVLGFRRPDAFDAAELTDLAADLVVWWSGNLQPISTDDLTLRAIVCTALDSEEAPSIEYTTTLPVTGSLVEESLPNNVTLAIKFSTAERGRSGRGRNYLMGLQKDQEGANLINSTYANQFVDAYLQLLAEDVLPAGTQWAVLSRFADNAPRDPGVASLVTGVSLTDYVCDSQRRRLPGRGT